MNICVYGASSSDIDERYITAVTKLGEEMSIAGHGLVFGGGTEGLMGAVVRGISSKGGFSLGIAPTFFDKPGILHKSCSEFIFTETMRERKQLMEEYSDAFIMVPGGIGTYEEFFEVLTLKQLGQLNKPIAIFNVNGYYDSLSIMLDKSIEEGFIKPRCKEIYGIFDEPVSLLRYIENETENPLDLTNLKNI